jgi:K+-sensing histidine kinase KdpD
MGDPNLIESALNILFNFILDSSNNNETVQVKVSQINSDINIEFQFVCEDPSQDALMYLFERNSYQHQDKFGMSDTRLQLPLARQIIEEHGGEISSINENVSEKNLKVHLQASL